MAASIVSPVFEAIFELGPVPRWTCLLLAIELCMCRVIAAFMLPRAVFDPLKGPGIRTRGRPAPSRF